MLELRFLKTKQLKSLCPVDSKLQRTCTIKIRKISPKTYTIRNWKPKQSTRLRSKLFVLRYVFEKVHLK